MKLTLELTGASQGHTFLVTTPQLGINVAAGQLGGPLPRWAVAGCIC
jgi:hypothetical protein